MQQAQSTTILIIDQNVFSCYNFWVSREAFLSDLGKVNFSSVIFLI